MGWHYTPCSMQVTYYSLKIMLAYRTKSDNANNSEFSSTYINMYGNVCTYSRTINSYQIAYIYSTTLHLLMCSWLHRLEA